MNRLRLLFVTASALVFVMLFAEPVLSAIRTQQGQIGITVVVNVAGTPIAYAPGHAPQGTSPGVIAANVSLHAVPTTLQRGFHAESLQFVGGSSKVIAQAQVQHSVLVQAEVTPNPNATLLWSNNPVVTMPTAAPGQTVTSSCAFKVTVDTTKSWSLEQGLSNDFTSTFPGKDLGNNTYVYGATPLPTATPYAVYADDGSVWTVIESGLTATTYCVDLTVTIPADVTDGTYSTNAIYTLFF
jgi:hypothetical protein